MYINNEHLQRSIFQDTYRIQITKDYEDYDTVQKETIKAYAY